MYKLYIEKMIAKIKKFLEMRKNPGFVMNNRRVVPRYLFHGTTSVYVSSIEKNGFTGYFSGSYKKAKGWAEIKCKKVGGKPVVYYIEAAENPDWEFERVPFTPGYIRLVNHIDGSKLIQVGKLEGLLLSI